MERDKKDQDLPHRDQQEMEEHARQSRKEMDEIPPHGTDPLHEGP